VKLRNRLAWLALCAIVLLAAWISLDLVQRGRIFLIRLPFDREPSSVEVRHAVARARQWSLPALLFLSIASFAVVLSVRKGPIDALYDVIRRLGELIRMRAVLSSLFALACLADLLSTLWYFHKYGLEDELHPGIKLVTFAWGLTVGCLVAKGIHASLVLLVCALFPKIARPVLIVTTIAYSAAAAWNLGFFG
jgi:hypothetical protein